MSNDHPGAVQVPVAARTPAAWPSQPGLLRALSRYGVLIPDEEAVLGYLREHPDTQQAVVALCGAVRARFPAPTQLSLELYVDPEIDERHLSLYVRQTEYEADILDQIEDAASTVADDLTKTSGWVIATTDFRTV